MHVARSLGLRGAIDEELTAALVSSLTQLQKDVGIPQSFRETGIDEREFEETIDRVSEFALKAGPTVFSPRPPSPEGLKELYMQAFRGEPLN